MSATPSFAAAVALLAAAMPASAGTVYMTGSNNPWGISDDEPGSPESAMNRAFGSGAWTKVQGFTTDVFKGDNRFVYIEGGDGAGIADFLNGGGRDAIEQFVTAGGAVFVNAARNDTYDPLDVGFGFQLTGGAYSGPGQLTAAGLAANLDRLGAGSGWYGDYFAHDSVGCDPTRACGLGTTYVEGDSGPIVVGAGFGEGYLLVGGQTAPYFHAEGGPQLRANELAFASGLGQPLAANRSIGAVPEPATWSMLITGFALIGASVRRKRLAPALSPAAA